MLYPAFLQNQDRTICFHSYSFVLFWFFAQFIWSPVCHVIKSLSLVLFFVFMLSQPPLPPPLLRWKQAKMSTTCCVCRSMRVHVCGGAYTCECMVVHVWYKSNTHSKLRTLSQQNVSQDTERERRRETVAVIECVISMFQDHIFISGI